MSERKRALFVFSGGFDSVAMLKHLLRDTDYILDVVRLECTKNNTLEVVEKEGTVKIIEYFKDPKNNYREFNFWTRPVKLFKVTMFVSRRQLAEICNERYIKDNIKYDYAMIGRNKEDAERRAGPMTQNSTYFYNVILNRDLKTKLTYPIEEWDKSKVVTSLPVQLYKYISTCRLPKMNSTTPDPEWLNWYTPCTQCISCKDMQAVLEKNEQLKRIPTLSRYLPQDQDK